MTTKNNIICISSIDWDFIWQGHQEIMSAFAKNGNRVLFIENTGIRAPGLSDISRLQKRFRNWLNSVKGFRKENDNLFIYSPMMLPFPYSKLACFFNKYLLLGPLTKWMKAADFYDPIIWTFLPTGTGLDIIDHINHRLLIYYCIADFYKLVDNPKKVKKTEDELIKKSDLIFAQGAALKAKCEKLNKDVHIFPFGVRMETFERFACGSGGRPDDMRTIKKPVIGYIGGIHRHIDFELIKFIAKMNPEKSVVLVGPAQADISAIQGLKNVFLPGKKEFEALPAYIQEFDVCIIPYSLNEYTQTVFPTKLNEYHALGKPVVSTALPEVLNFNRENGDLVLIGNTKEEFNEQLRRAMELNGKQLINSRIESAKNNSWAGRIEKMGALIEQKLIDKEKERAISWKDGFLKLYKKSSRKLVAAAAITAALYFGLFYTPIVWFMAAPLKISDTIQKADAIVVFAGGVGESGKSGQGYEERVKYATELYQNGYADHLIFSSGYMYLFKEPLIMKALAISLGVPDEAIILEDRARSTLENVKFTAEILRKHKWDKILLVSSPYHMKRAALVFKKNAPDITVVCTPIDNSHFYFHPSGTCNTFGRQANLAQVEGIMHEYLGIVYYWFKGYIR